MKRILIWNSFPLRERNGGPPTYLFNLKRSFEKDTVSKVEITFLPNANENKINNQSKKKYKRLRFIKYIINNYIGKKPLCESYSEYDAIHFHIAFDIYKNRHWLKKYRGEVFFTPHSPEPAHIEIANEIYGLENKLIDKILRKIIEKQEIESFKIADKLIFPCEDAIEPYRNWFNNKNVIDSNKKIRYALTCIEPVTITSTISEIRNRLGIPAQATVICYAGRHNVVKGYDLLSDVCIKLLNKYENLYVVCLGKEGPLPSPNHKRWIELGWSESPHDYINACDLFILPNKQTYFDLIMLEVMSLNVSILASNTGGNKYYKKFESKSLTLFNSKSEMEKAIENYINNPSKVIVNNKKIFDENFNIGKFSKYMTSAYLE